MGGGVGLKFGRALLITGGKCLATFETISKKRGALKNWTQDKKNCCENILPPPGGCHMTTSVGQKIRGITFFAPGFPKKIHTPSP